MHNKKTRLRKAFMLGSIVKARNVRIHAHINK